SAIHINTISFNIKPSNCFTKQNRYMILLLQLIIINYSLLIEPPVITSLARLLNASGENESKNCLYLLLSQISILFTAATSTISFCRSAYSFRFGGTSNR